MSTKYANYEEVKKAFINGRFEIVDRIHVAGIEFHLSQDSDVHWKDVILRNHKCYLTYSISDQHKEEAKAAGLDSILVLLWGVSQPDLEVIPYNIKMTNRRHISSDLVHEGADGEDPRVVGDRADVKFTSIPSKPTVLAKIDTGAEMSSLHADTWKVDREAGTVTFTNKEMSPNSVTMQLDDHQPIRSADGGTEYRPVVRLSVKINDIVISDVAFNLNDRSEMEFPILIGKNILQKGRFLIDPMKEGNEWDDDVVVRKLDVVTNDKISPEQAKDLYNLFCEMDISFSDLVKIIRTEAVADIKYITY